MLIIMFVFSGMTSKDSNSKSREIIKEGIVIVDKVFNLNLDDNEINKLVLKFNYPFRKICHFSEYFFLSLLVLLSLRTINVSITKSIVITLIFCIIFSISDEIHQMYVAGRSPLILDCFIDVSGSCLLCLIYFLRTKKSL